MSSYRALETIAAKAQALGADTPQLRGLLRWLEENRPSGRGDAISRESNGLCEDLELEDEIRRARR